MINEHFPTSFDVEETITYRTTTYQDIRMFLQGQGILSVGMSKQYIADFAGSILFEHQDYLVLRRIAQGGSTAANISGFTLQATRIPIEIDRLKDDLVSLRDTLIQQEQQLTEKGVPTKTLGMPQIKNEFITLRFEYQRLIPGRVELMQRVDTQVDITLEPITSTQWRVVCFPQANQDVKRVEQLFAKLRDGAYQPFTISLESFSQRQRIEFFDDLLEHYKSHKEWRFQQVTGITVKQVTPEERDRFTVEEEDLESYDTDDGDFEEASQNDLLSINQAILQGRHLRTNSFVKKCENQGFYFPSMTLLLENQKTPELIEVTIRFKLSPKMFEVVLTSMGEKTEMGETVASFTSERQQEILKEFWNASHVIWQRIYKEVPRPTRQLSFADESEPENHY
jgi:hypothetical protein